MTISNSPLTQQWYYASGKQKLGPLSFLQLKNLVIAGQLHRSSMLLPENARQWVWASAVAGLFPTATQNPVPSTPSMAIPLPRRGSRLLRLTAFGLVIVSAVSICVYAVTPHGFQPAAEDKEGGTASMKQGDTAQAATHRDAPGPAKLPGSDPLSPLASGGPSASGDIARNGLPGPLPFTLDELKEVAGEPTRVENGNWYFTERGKVFPYLVIFSPTPSRISLGLDNTLENSFAVTAIVASRLFRSDEQNIILNMAEEARRILPNDSSNRNTKTVGRYRVSYHARGSQWMLTVEATEAHTPQYPNPAQDPLPKTSVTNDATFKYWRAMRAIEHEMAATFNAVSSHPSWQQMNLGPRP
jgi:hypothetical protein